MSISSSTPSTPCRLSATRVLPAIAGIYISQTVITALTTQALPSLLRSEGASLTAAGLTALLWAPWGLRFLWAPWVERMRLPEGRLERRSRRVILTGQWMMAAILMALGAVSLIGQVTLDSFAVWLLSGLLLAALVAASTDVACDGFTVEQLAGQRRGWGNVAQVGGGYVGAMLGAGGFLLVAGTAGWPMALVAVGLVIALLGLPMLRVQEPPRDRTLAVDHRPGLRHALRRPQVRIGLLMLLLSSVGVRLTLGMFGPFMLDHGMTLERVGWLFGSLHIGAGLTGAVLGGLLVRAAPGWRAVWIAVGFKSCALLALTLAAPAASLTVLTVLVGLTFAVLGCFWVALYSALMNLASPLQAGVDFTVFQSADALLAMAGGVAGGWLAGRLGYAFCFGLACVLTIIAAGVVWRRARMEKGIPLPRKEPCMPDKQCAGAGAGVWGIMLPVRGRIRFAMALAGLAAACALGALVVLAGAVRALLADSGQWPWLPLALAALLTVLAFVLRLSAFNQSHYAAFRLETRLRTDLAEHLARVPLGYVQQTGSGALAKVMMDDVKALHVFVADSTPLYARAYASPVITFALLWWLDWRLALAATAVLALGMAVLLLGRRGGGEMMRRYHAAGEQVSKTVVEYVQAMPVVRAFDAGTSTFQRYQRALDEFMAVVLQWYRMAGLSSRLSAAILNPLPTLAVLVWLGGWLISRDALDAATWLAVLLVGAGMAESLLPLMSLKHLVAKTQMSIHRIQEVMAEPELPAPQAQQTREPADGSVCFEQVDFRYANDAPLVLRDVSFEAPQGTVTALVGPSGAGKTTAARLIPRFWDVSAGSIRIGGVDVREMQPDVLMRHVAFVFQDTFLFADTIANNIRLGAEGAAMSEVVAAARAAQAHDFIERLPQGYDTLAGERGVFLSGGQRQRITIARAILQNRPVLVLDEATAFADPENEAALVAALSILMRGKTVLMVAHRLSTIRDADQILVFDQGRLAERGSHDELAAQGGVYARLWRNYEKAQGWALAGERA